ncbi:phosphoribosylformylglycinamidine synthase I, partial [Clostridioides difficile]
PGGGADEVDQRGGALAAAWLVMVSIRRAVDGGRPVVGIGTGFQGLCESRLMPGTRMRNEKRRFHCSVQQLQVASVDTVWTGDFRPSERIHIAAKHGEGNYVADAATVAALEANNRVVFRYTANPNGSVHDIAGITNEAGNVVGLMPHPEHSVEELTG